MPLPSGATFCISQIPRRVMSVKAVIASMANAFSSLPLRFSRASAISSMLPPESKSRILYSTFLTSDFLSVFMGSYRTECASFSGDGKVEMIGSDSKHEFPRCDGHVGRILRNNRCKNRLVRSVFTVPLQSGGSGRKRTVYN